jgi:hypothetical protein
MGTRNPFTPFREARRPAKVLLYGEPGTEKTRRALLQTPEPRAYIDMEASAAMYHKLAGEKDAILVTRRLRGRDSVMEALAFIEENPELFATVVIDPITTIWEQLQAAFRERLASFKRRKFPDAQAEDVIIEPGHWNALNTSHGDIMARLLSLRQHVVLIGRGKDIRDKDTEQVVAHEFDGWKRVPSLVSTVIETHLEFDVVKKDRSGALTPGRVKGHVDMSALFQLDTVVVPVERESDAAVADASAGERKPASQTTETKPKPAAAPNLAEARKVAIAHFTKIERLAQVEFLFGPSGSWSQADLDKLREWSMQKPLPTFLESVRGHLEARGLLQEAMDQFGPHDDPETAWDVPEVATWIRATHPVGGANG